MHFADEIRPTEGLAPEDVKVEKRELDMAAELIEQYKGAFEPERYRDTYHDALCEIIKAKREGKEIVAPEVEEPERPTDLMEALRASIEAARTRRASGEEDGGGGRQLDRLSKEELYRLAKKADVPGRADMSKQELIEALEAA
jgi:DNA end-binding protein Ku